MIDKNPPGATHYAEIESGLRRHYMCTNSTHRVWLGEKHGGWSFELPYKKFNMHKLKKVKK